MIKFLQAGIFLGGMLLSLLCHGQEVNPPLGTLPIFYNSSFAGEGDVPRINSNLSYGWNYSIISQTSIDMFVPAIGSGIGITTGITSDNSYNLGLAIAPKFSLGGKLTISPSLDFELFKGVSPDPQINGFNSRIGLRLNTPKFFIGYSILLLRTVKYEYGHLTETIKENFPNYHVKNMQVGYTFQRSPDSKFSVTPQISVFFFDRMHIARTMFNVNFRHNKFLWGISDYGLHVGWQTQRFRIMVFNNVQRFLNIHRSESTSTLSLRYSFKK